MTNLLSENDFFCSCSFSLSAFVFEYSLHPYCAKTMHETKVEALPNSLCSNIMLYIRPYLSEISCTSITYNDKSFWYHYWLIYWYLTLDSSRWEKTKSVLYLAIVCDECSQFLISLFVFFQYTVHCWVAFEKGEHCSFSSESQAPKLWCEIRKKRQNYEYIYIEVDSFYVFMLLLWTVK